MFMDNEEHGIKSEKDKKEEKSEKSRF